jgi:endonuclease/exonuclease/phosphatase family metal-dependent hydrolase
MDAHMEGGSMNLKTISLATFNLFNLNEPGRAIYTNKNGWTQEQYDKKIAWTASQLRLLEADIFGFQELWHPDSLHNALNAAGLADSYDLLIPEEANGTKIVCASLVRKGLLAGAPQWIQDFPEAFVLRSEGDDPQTPLIEVNIRGFSRPVLHFTVKPREQGPLVHVYVCHLKSKAPTQVYNEAWFKEKKATYGKHAKGLGSALSTIRRTAEAAALRFLLTESMKGNDAPVIVLGDINDGQHSNTANVLTDQPRYLVGDSEGGGDTALYTAQTLQEYRDTRDVYYTHIFQDVRESLDHILVSQEFYDNSRKRLWMFDGMVVNNDHLNFDDHKGLGSNDHGIIRATFKYKPAAD